MTTERVFMRHRLAYAALLCATLGACGPTQRPASQPQEIKQAQEVRQGTWSTTLSGCRVWNPAPNANEAVSWSGVCENGFAQGDGIEQWYEGGVAGNRFEGKMLNGKWVGAVVVVYPNGARYEGELAVNGDRLPSGKFTPSP